MTESSEIKVGDTVQLKSGGPKMTAALVTQPVRPNSMTVVRCDWFAGHAPYQKAFPAKTLRKIGENDPYNEKG